MMALEFLIKALISVLCFVCCTMLMIDAWQKYSRETTSSGTRMRYSAEEAKPFPCITFCPVPGFKNETFAYSKELVDEYKFEMKDIFSPYTVTLLGNKSLYEVVHVFSHFSGFCYTICYLPKTRLQSAFIFYLNMHFNVKVLLHDRGAKIWLSGYQKFPFPITKVTINTYNTDGYTGAVVSVKEVESTARSTARRQCTSPGTDRARDLEDFNQCSKQRFRNFLNSLKGTTCKIVEMEYFLQENVTMPYCQNAQSAKYTFKQFCTFLSNFSRNPPEYGCSLPCRHGMYTATIDYYHDNLMVSYTQESGYFSLLFQYITLDVEEQIENLDYDLGNLLVSTGGNLGLFLGFSCLSVLLGLANRIFRINCSDIWPFEKHRPYLPTSDDSAIKAGNSIGRTHNIFSEKLSKS